MKAANNLEIYDVEYDFNKKPSPKDKFIPGRAFVILGVVNPDSRYLIQIEAPVLFVLAQPLEQINPIFFN